MSSREILVYGGNYGTNCTLDDNEITLPELTLLIAASNESFFFLQTKTINSKDTCATTIQEFNFGRLCLLYDHRIHGSDGKR